MFPFGDYNPTYSRPYVTYALIAINTLVFLWQSTLGQADLFRMYLDYAVVPAAITANPLSLETALDGLRSMFMHGGWGHLGFNMLYLWVFGDNIEDRLGKPLFILFYLVSGFVAIFAQVVVDPHSPIPMIGASGAIGGVLGAYFVIFPQAPIRTLVFFVMRDLPAVIVLGFWFIIQLFNGAASLGAQNAAGGGTAFFAHIGGFVAGMVLIWIHKRIVGAPEVLRGYNIAATKQAMRANQLHVIPPDPTLDATQRQIRRAEALATLAPLVDNPVWMLTEGRAFYGRILDLDPQVVVVQEKDGRYQIPLENLAQIG